MKIKVLSLLMVVSLLLSALPVLAVDDSSSSADTSIPFSGVATIDFDSNEGWLLGTGFSGNGSSGGDSSRHGVVNGNQYLWHYVIGSSSAQHTFYTLNNTTSGVEQWPPTVGTSFSSGFYPTEYIRDVYPLNAFGNALASASSGGLSFADLQSWGGDTLYETLTNANVDLSNHPYGLDWWFAGGASNSWSIHGSLNSSSTLTGNGLLPLLVGQNTFLYSSLSSISSLLTSNFNTLFHYFSVSSGSFLLADGSVGTSSLSLPFSDVFNRSYLGLASILRGSSGSSVTIGSQSSNNILSALDSLGLAIIPDKWSGTIHGSSADSIAELLVNLGSSLMSGSSVSSSSYSFDDSYNLITTPVSSSSLAHLLVSSLNAIQRDTAQIRAVQASDEDIEFKQSTSDVVDAVKDDWTGSSSQSGLSASQSHELSGYQKELGNIYSTDVSSIGDGLNLLSDGTVWSSWLTQGVADSLDTVSVPATIDFDGSVFNIPEIDLSSSAVHEPSGMAFDDLLGGD